MTAQTEAAPTPAPKTPKTATVNPVLKGVPAGVGLSALLSYAAGTAAHFGWHLSMPFLPTWLLMLVAFLLTSHITGIVAGMWHFHKLQASPQIAAMVKAAEVLAEAQAKDYLAEQGVK